MLGPLLFSLYVQPIGNIIRVHGLCFHHYVDLQLYCHLDLTATALCCSKCFYAYVRSKQKVRDKVGPQENNSGNIISDGFQMAEVLNEHFSSVFTTEDISSLPVPFSKFEGNK